jgi:hypothetical protein
VLGFDGIKIHRMTGGLLFSYLLHRTDTDERQVRISSVNHDNNVFLHQTQ